MSLLHRHCKSDSYWKWDGITVKACVCYVHTTVVTVSLLQPSCEGARWEKYSLFLLTEKSFRHDPWKHSLLRAILLCFLHIAKAFSSDPVKDLSTCVTSADSLFKTKETGDMKVTDESWACPFSWTRISFFKEYSHTRYYNYMKIRAKKVVEIICIYVSFLFWSCLSCNIASHYQRRK